MLQGDGGQLHCRSYAVVLEHMADALKQCPRPSGDPHHEVDQQQQVQRESAMGIAEMEIRLRRQLMASVSWPPYAEAAALQALQAPSTEAAWRVLGALARILKRLPGHQSAALVSTLLPRLQGAAHQLHPWVLSKWVSTAAAMVLSPAHEAAPTSRDVGGALAFFSGVLEACFPRHDACSCSREQPHTLHPAPCRARHLLARKLFRCASAVATAPACAVEDAASAWVEATSRGRWCVRCALPQAVELLQEDDGALFQTAHDYMLWRTRACNLPQGSVLAALPAEHVFLEVLRLVGCDGSLLLELLLADECGFLPFLLVGLRACQGHRGGRVHPAWAVLQEFHGRVAACQRKGLLPFDASALLRRLGSVLDEA